MISAIRLDGVATAMVTEGAMNSWVFQGFVDHFLVPVLRAGDIVVMDNLSSHKANRVVEAIEMVGAEVWYLPPYSPDFNPIEQMWSKVKNSLRSYAARTKRTLVTAIGKALRRAAGEKLPAAWFGRSNGDVVLGQCFGSVEPSVDLFHLGTGDRRLSRVVVLQVMHFGVRASPGHSQGTCPHHLPASQQHPVPLAL